jgi:hypothetical protein
MVPRIPEADPKRHGHIVKGSRERTGKREREREREREDGKESE